MKNKKNTFLWVLVLIVCLIPGLIGVFHSGFFVSDDGHWMIIRLSAFYEGLSSGQFPTRFLPRLNQGFGYPVADFLYPLFLYIGSILHILKIPFILDVKIILAGSMLFSGIGMFLYLKHKVNDFSAFLGGILYIYLPYHLYDIYTRGSVGEVLSLAIVPFLFWSVEKKSWILLSLFLGLLVLAHNTLALFFLPIIILYGLLQGVATRFLVKSVGLGLGFASFFWIPALIDRQFTVFGTTVVANPAQYFVNTVGYGLIGWIAIVLFVGTLLFKSTFRNKEVLFFLCIGIMSLFFSLSLSSVFWRSNLLTQLVQFPFRFLSITLIAESFLGAYILNKFNNKIIPTGILVLLLGFSSWPYLFPKQYDYHDNAYYATNLATTTVQNEYMPKWVKKIPTEYSPEKVFIQKNSGVVNAFTQKGTRLSFAVTMKQTSRIHIGYVYFPGWKAYVDGRPVVVEASTSDGLVTFTIPKGTHAVVVSYGETHTQLLADIISLLSIGCLVFLFIKKRYEK